MHGEWGRGAKLIKGRGGLAARGVHCVPSWHLSCPLWCQEHKPGRAWAAQPLLPQPDLLSLPGRASSFALRVPSSL